VNIEFIVRTFFLALGGITVSLKIVFVTLIIGMPAGFLLALVQMRKTKVLYQISGLYTSLIRGTPTVVQILLVYSIAPGVIATILRDIGSGMNAYDLNPIFYAYLVFSLNITATLSEVFRSALSTVNRGQLEAALTVGLSAVQAYRRIIIPQAMVSAVPNLCTVVTTLIKNTSLAFIMTIKDITAIAKIEAAFGYNYIEAYIDIWIIYLILCFGVEVLFKIIEKRLNVHRIAV
jgi:L-cystine transport system permease protein